MMCSKWIEYNTDSIGSAWLKCNAASWQANVLKGCWPKHSAAFVHGTCTTVSSFVEFAVGFCEMCHIWVLLDPYSRAQLYCEWHQVACNGMTATDTMYVICARYTMIYMIQCACAENIFCIDPYSRAQLIMQNLYCAHTHNQLWYKSDIQSVFNVQVHRNASQIRWQFVGWEPIEHRMSKT